MIRSLRDFGISASWWFVTAVAACGKTNLELPSLLLLWVLAVTSFLDLLVFDVKDFVEVVDFLSPRPQPPSLPPPQKKVCVRVTR